MIHWTASRKADIIKQIRAGEITEGEARRVYDLSPEELATWRRKFAMGGKAALKVSRIQHHPPKRFAPSPSKTA